MMAQLDPPLEKVYICMYVYVYIYIYIYTYIHTHLYVYIYRERERERERCLYWYFSNSTQIATTAYLYYCHTDATLLDPPLEKAAGARHSRKAHTTNSSSVFYIYIFVCVCVCMYVCAHSDVCMCVHIARDGGGREGKGERKCCWCTRHSRKSFTTNSSPVLSLDIYIHTCIHTYMHSYLLEREYRYRYIYV
jgi:hypothetical protein